ncbi:MAG: hypothetical protein AAF927_02280 [Bacteroidota bacterium]
MIKNKFPSILGAIFFIAFILGISGCLSSAASTEYILMSRSNLSEVAIKNDCDPVDPVVWKADLDDFINEFKEDIEQLNEQAKKKKNTSTILTVVGTAVGVSGAATGVIAPDSETKVAEITSLVTGGITTVMGTISSGEKSEKLSDCAKEVDQALNEFVAKWPITSAPKNCEQNEEYRLDRIELTQKIGKANDCTTPGAQKIFEPE